MGQLIFRGFRASFPRKLPSASIPRWPRHAKVNYPVIAARRLHRKGEHKLDGGALDHKASDCEPRLTVQAF